MRRLPFALATLGVSLLLAGCYTVGEPKALNPATGRIDTGVGAAGVTMADSAKTATVVTSKQVNLAKYKRLLLTLGGDFFRDQSRLVGYFDRVEDREGMEKLLIAENMSDTVSDVTNYLSWKKIADHYGQFLVLKPDSRSADKKEYFILKAIDPSTAEDLFVAEVQVSGVFNDQLVLYPLYNAFLDWVEANSGSTFGTKPTAP